jgi:GDPmannose 4,6-dehydratase
MMYEVRIYMRFYMNNVAIITGITGQDGAYLTQLLLEKGFKVYGVVKNSNSSNFSKLRFLNIDIDIDIDIIEVNLMSYEEVYGLLKKIKPTHLYNLASQSSVGLSNFEPYETYLFNSTSVLNILESIRKTGYKIKFFQALSSEIYGMPENLPITELESISPINIYAASKTSNYHLINVYRNTFNIFASSGIFFNHESVLRTGDFFVKKVIQSAVEVKQGIRDKVHLGNLEIKRDFGSAKEYMEAAYIVLEAEKPDDFIISSGKSILLKDIVIYIFEKLDIGFEKLEIDNILKRRNEVINSYGSSAKIHSALCWEYEQDFFRVIDDMVDFELNKNKL